MSVVKPIRVADNGVDWAEIEAPDELDPAIVPAGMPSAHASTHYDGDSDPVDVTQLDGYTGETTKFLRADGSFAAPSIGSLSGLGPLYSLTPPPLVASGVATTLNGGITNVATSITVTSSTGFPATPFIALIGTEEIKVTNVSGTTWTVARGYGQPATTAASHSNGDMVTLLRWHWWYQQSLGIATQTGDYIFFSIGAPTGSALRRAYARLIPSGIAVLTIAISPLLFSTLSSNRFIGLFLGEAGTGKSHFLIFGQSNTGPVIYFQRAPSPFSTGTATSEAGPIYCATGNPLFLKVDLSTSNVVYSISPDGSNWIQLYSVAKTTPFTTAPDEWGVMGLATSLTVHDSALSLLSLVEA